MLPWQETSRPPTALRYPARTMTHPRRLLQLLHFIRNSTQRRSLRELAQWIASSPFQLQHELLRCVQRLAHDASVLNVRWPAASCITQNFTRATQQRADPCATLFHLPIGNSLGAARCPP